MMGTSRRKFVRTAAVAAGSIPWLAAQTRGSASWKRFAASITPVALPMQNTDA